MNQEQLKRLLHYDPDTGIFRAVTARGKIEVGDVVGYKNPRGYIEIGVGYLTHRAHHLAFLYMTGEKVKGVDHIDCDPSNNRWNNLRKATQLENMWNRRTNHNSQTGMKGVHPHGNKFKVQFRVFGKKVYLGLFDSAEEAKSHHDEFVKLFQGEFFCRAG